jgi:phosphoglycerate dehydrogenase-like enzyme
MLRSLRRTNPASVRDVSWWLCSKCSNQRRSVRFTSAMVWDMLPRRTLVYTAEHVLLPMLSLAKYLLVADKVVCSDDYDPSLVKPVNDIAYNWQGLANIGGIHGYTLGIVGLGEVGALVVERARAFGMTIIYSNRTRLPAARALALGVSYRPLDALLAESGFVSLHASNIGRNDQLIDRAAFASMKRTAFFINTSRGPLVDEDALFDAMAAGTIAGAGARCASPRAAAGARSLRGASQVVTTPHIPGGSRLGVLKEATALFANMRCLPVTRRRTGASSRTPASPLTSRHSVRQQVIALGPMLSRSDRFRHFRKIRERSGPEGPGCAFRRLHRRPRVCRNIIQTFNQPVSEPTQPNSGHLSATTMSPAGE